MRAYFIISLFLLAVAFAEEKCTPDRKVIDKVLKKYDRKREPDGVVDVEATMWLSDVEKVCSKSATAVIDIYLNEKWTDARLDYSKYNPCHTPIKVSMKHLWSPKLGVIDSRSFEVHESPTKNIFTLLYANGTVWTNLRAKIGLGCNTSNNCTSMTCSFAEESYLYSAEKVKLFWSENPFVVLKSGSLAHWKLDGHKVSASAPEYPAGTWNEIKVELQFSKKEKCEA